MPKGRRETCAATPGKDVKEGTRRIPVNGIEQR